MPSRISRSAEPPLRLVEGLRLRQVGHVRGGAVALGTCAEARDVRLRHAEPPDPEAIRARRAVARDACRPAMRQQWLAAMRWRGSWHWKKARRGRADGFGSV